MHLGWVATAQQEKTSLYGFTIASLEVAGRLPVNAARFLSYTFRVNTQIVMTDWLFDLTFRLDW